uniref:Cubilin n=1 Tax=Stomoxys calcitrans TaxID=35570 RepID=A0A1I8PUZ9_STOCA
MSFPNKCYILVVFTLATGVIGAELHTQPRVEAKKGDLIIQAALDCNISLRLNHGSSLLINNTNVLMNIQQHQNPNKLDDPNVTPLLRPTSKEFHDELNSLRNDIDRLSQLMSSFRNRSQYALQTNVVSRHLIRLRRLEGRLLALEVYLGRDECAGGRNPCENGGTCFDGYKDYHCECPEGWKGCHRNPLFDACEQHICQNNGTCLTRGRGTSCLCPDGYSGVLCETADNCHPNPCENGGSCKTQSNQTFKCACQRGSTGKRCEVVRSVCSTIQRKPMGELTYPTDGATEYAPDERCAWLVRTLPTQVLNLTFTSFDLEEDPECSRDWLQIHDGSSLASQLIGRFCGKDLPLGGNILSSQHTLFFWFRSDNATNRPGFHMSWQSQLHVCGDIQEVSFRDEGILRSPGYPGKMPAHRECEWELSAPFGYRFALRLFDISMGSVANCGGDTFEIYDGDLLLREYCKSTSSEHLTTSTNKLKLHFHTDQHGSDSSFQLHYEVESAKPHCGGIFTEATGLVAGPVYGEAAICLYLIQQPSNTQIHLEFEHEKLFELENCNLNSIEIFDGRTDEDSRLAINCGGHIQPSVKSFSNFILIRYMNKLSGGSNQRSFKAKYTRVCEFVYSGSESGIITTPHYPEAYAEQITCTYRIYGPVNQVVRANFTDIFFIATKHSANESQTYLEVYLSESERRRYYKATAMEIISELNKMVIVFHVGHNAGKAGGFRLQYSFDADVCGGVHTEMRGTFGHFMASTQCKFIFEAPEGKSIHLQFFYYKGNDWSTTQIYGNISDGSSFLIRNITSRHHRVNETFPFNLITIIASPLSLFVNASYEFQTNSQDCGGSFDWLYGAIKSPNWPSSYGADLQCVWIITAPLGSKIELKVQNFTLEPDCAGDFLEIRNGQFSNSPLIGRYCGDQITTRIPSFGNSLYLKFTSDSSVEGRGFHLNWQQTQTGCGGKLTSYKGSIHTPHMDELAMSKNNAEGSTTCDWLIIVAQGSGIRLKVTSSSESSDACRHYSLQMYDGSNAQKSLLPFNCSSLLEVSSTSNQVLIVYNLNNYSLHRPEFMVDYETNCNMTLNLPRGIIESPNFPEPYPELLNCKWVILAGPKNKIQLAFSHLSLELSTNDVDECAHDYVEVQDWQSTDLLKTYRICSRIPEPITGEGNYLSLHFVSDYSHSKNGFRAEYSQLGCGAELTQEFGSIKSPNYPYSGVVHCQWNIEVPAGKQIVFTLLEFQADIGDSFDCNRNGLTVKDTQYSPSSLLVQCPSLQSAHMVTSTMNHLYIDYRSETSNFNHNFFKAMYRTKEASCGGELISHYSIITSPNYPHNSTHSHSCRWELKMPDALEIIAHFSDIELAYSDCTQNAITILEYQGTKVSDILSFCGSADKRFIKLSGNNATIMYETVASQLGSRFSLVFYKMCGGNIEADSGMLKANAMEYCSWKFSVPEGSIISINIVEWDCNCQKNASACQYYGLRYVKNYDDLSKPSEVVNFKCELPQTNLHFETSSLKLFAEHVYVKNYDDLSKPSEVVNFKCELPQTNLHFETSSLKLFAEH